MNITEFRSWIHEASTREIASQLSRVCVSYGIQNHVIEQHGDMADGEFFTSIIERYIEELTRGNT